MSSNKFNYVNYADRIVRENLLDWQQKIEDYLIEFYQ